MELHFQTRTYQFKHQVIDWIWQVGTTESHKKCFKSVINPPISEWDIENDDKHFIATKVENYRHPFHGPPGNQWPRIRKTVLYKPISELLE